MRSVTSIIALAALVGCSANAIIYRTDGTVVVGPIVGSDQAVIEVAGHGETIRVERADIADIDHPGNGWMLYGLLPTMGGGLMLGLAQDADDKLARFTFVLMAIPALAAGLPSLIWGAHTWAGSKGRSESREPPTTVSVTPTGVQVTF
ncbi:MAG: hypothetical protein H6701_14715 [Myxococcales bacterium]|nr:hypothetical protein [Myxococcales bacterium]